MARKEGLLSRQKKSGVVFKGITKKEEKEKSRRKTDVLARRPLSIAPREGSPGTESKVPGRKLKKEKRTYERIRGTRMLKKKGCTYEEVSTKPEVEG